MHEFTRETVFQDLPVIPASAQIKINVPHILKFIYEYAAANGKRRERPGLPKGIIVRTFDINKPGSERVSGTVIGGSILKGTFSVGEKIVILPLAIEAQMLSMKTEKTDLYEAHVGGLIALQTDVNPSYCNALTGCAFVKDSDYIRENLLPGGSLLKIKYHLLRSCPVQKLKKDDRITINYAGFHADIVVVKASSERSRLTVSICKPLYLFPNEDVTFTMVLNKRLVGCGRCNQRRRQRYF